MDWKIFADASYGDNTDSKSTSGVVHAYNGSVFDWKCKKQGTVALSTTEAELTALNYAIADLDWVIQLFRDAKLNLQIPIAVYQDNQAGITLVTSESCKQRTKHLQIKMQHAKDCIARGLVDIRYMPGKSIPADLLSKPLLMPINTLGDAHKYVKNSVNTKAYNNKRQYVAAATVLYRPTPSSPSSSWRIRLLVTMAIYYLQCQKQYANC